MKLRRKALLSGLAVASLTMAFAGSAVAGNGNGKGSENGNGNGGGNGNGAKAADTSAPAASSPGNSAAAPGQVKKDPTAPPPTAPAAAATPTAQTPAAQTSTPAPPSASAGVKPSNDTQKSTACVSGGSAGATTCASADPHANSSGHGDASKQYGNGKTAAQIAVSRGGSGATLHGPGNSQPHKVTPCNGGKHGRDVHAVKTYGAAQCGESSSPPPHSPPPPHVDDPPRTTPHADPPTTKTEASTPPSVIPQSVTPPSATPTPGKPRDPKPSAKPVRHLGDPAARSAASRVLGRLGAVGTVAAGQTLPFTGLPLWIVAVAGLGLIAGGLTLRRTARQSAR